MNNPAALSTSTILAVLGAVHLYWLGGGRRGGRAAIPSRDGKPLFTPSATATSVVALLLFAAAGVVLTEHSWGCATLTVVFAARAIGDFRWLGFFKRVRGTAFAKWDTWLYSPLCLLISLGCASAARNWILL